jgi:hypothetical protein
MLNQDALFPMPQAERTTDDYWTPKWLFDALGITFDLDVACPPSGPPHGTARAFYTQETDGLASDWFGNVWMNPPFSKTNDWAYKFMKHRNGICLVPMSKSRWFDALWADAEAVCALPYNLRFGGHEKGSIFIACVLFAYGSHNVEALHSSNIGRVRC